MLGFLKFPGLRPLVFSTARFKGSPAFLTARRLTSFWSQDFPEFIEIRERLLPVHANLFHNPDQTVRNTSAAAVNTNDVVVQEDLPLEKK